MGGESAADAADPGLGPQCLDLEAVSLDEGGFPVHAQQQVLAQGPDPDPDLDLDPVSLGEAGLYALPQPQQLEQGEGLIQGGLGQGDEVGEVGKEEEENASERLGEEVEEDEATERPLCEEEKWDDGTTGGRLGEEEDEGEEEGEEGEVGEEDATKQRLGELLYPSVAALLQQLLLQLLPEPESGSGSGWDVEEQVQETACKVSQQLCLCGPWGCLQGESAAVSVRAIPWGCLQGESAAVLVRHTMGLPAR